MTATLPARLWKYQAERFPVFAYLPLVVIGVAAAVAYARVLRAPDEPFHWAAGMVGAYTVLVLFFLLRVLDEHKDAATDARYRPDLPVPRGLVTLRELRAAAAVTLALAVAFNSLVDPRLLLPMFGVGAWAALMAREFFVRDWLRARPLWYLLSHMVIMPLIFLYATSVDWLPGSGRMPREIWIFLALAFLNGLVIEIGRKLRAPADEREGVDTYTSAWGLATACFGWLVSLLGAAVFTGLAAREAGHGSQAAAILLWLCAIHAAPAVWLWRRRRSGAGKNVERFAGTWVLLSYLVVLIASLRGPA